MARSCRTGAPAVPVFRLPRVPTISRFLLHPVGAHAEKGDDLQKIRGRCSGVKRG